MEGERAEEGMEVGGRGEEEKGEEQMGEGNRAEEEMGEGAEVKAQAAAGVVRGYCLASLPSDEGAQAIRLTVGLATLAAGQ